MIGTSDDWGASKPDPRFFRRIAHAVPFAVHEILYDGDQCDNDIRPAQQTGMFTALVRGGPWSTIQWNSTEATELPTFRVEGLRELPYLIREFNSSGR